MLGLLKRNKKTHIITGLAILLCVLGVGAFSIFFNNGGKTVSSYVLTVETPQKISRSADDTVIIDVSVSDLGDVLYPAASMSISFDPLRLEFLGIEEGNVFIHSDSSTSGRALPDWRCSTAACNESGLINVMYLDMTGGKNAFSKDLLAEDGNVVLRLKFRLRGSIREGDVCDLIVEDAVFAASDEVQSLAMTTGSLTVRNGRIVIGG